MSSITASSTDRAAPCMLPAFEVTPYLLTSFAGQLAKAKWTAARTACRQRGHFSDPSFAERGRKRLHLEPLICSSNQIYNTGYNMGYNTGAGGQNYWEKKIVQQKRMENAFFEIFTISNM